MLRTRPASASDPQALTGALPGPPPAGTVRLKERGSAVAQLEPAWLVNRTLTVRRFLPSGQGRRERSLVQAFILVAGL